jgi:chemotaxis protein methyltransferase CheR
MTLATPTSATDEYVAFRRGAAAQTIGATRPEVRGTDIDARIIARARTARFSLADARDAPRRELERWFHREGAEYVARPELRRGVRFDVDDLPRLRVSPASYELILWRNTVIDFNRDVRDDLHRRLADALRPGGVLVVGATERVADATALGLSATHPFTYGKAR